MRERGLKPCRSPCGSVEFTKPEIKGVVMVAPHAGAWIETDFGYGLHVAPHAGAWIETPDKNLAETTPSLPMRERGLKPPNSRHCTSPTRRSPCGSVD